MKRGYIAILAMLCVVSCDNEYDDASMLQRVEEIKKDQADMEQTITELQNYKKELDARLATGDAITSVERFEDVNGKSGYTISFKFSEAVVVYDGVDGEDGAKGDKGADGEDVPAGATGDKGDKGDTGADGEDAKLEYFNYVDGGTQITIKLYNPTTEAFEEYTFPLDGAAAVAAPVAFTLGSDGEDAVLNATNNSVTINLPETLTEAQYGSIVVELLSADGEMASSAVTRAASNWVIAITAPTFTDGAYNKDAKITLSQGSAMATSGEIKVTFTTGDGFRSSSAIGFTYSL